MIRRWLAALFFAPMIRAAQVLIWLGHFGAADRALRVCERLSRLAAVVVVLSLPVLAQVPASKPFDLASMWAPWTGQVAGLCGPGKNCTVQTITATSTGAAVRLPYGGTVGWPVSTAPTASISAPSASVIRLSASGGYIETNGALRKTAGGGPAAVTVEDSDGFALIGLAFSSFPTCAAGNIGDIQRDSTSGAYRVCDGAFWQVLGRTLTVPSILSGFGTSPTLVGGSRANTLQVQVGTGGVATNGTIRLNFDAVNGWNCTCSNFTSNNTLVCVQCSDDVSANGDIQFCSRNYSGVTTAFNAGDNLKITCEPF